MSIYHPVKWETFVVRLWRESASGTWRGQIVHMPGRESVYFATLAQAIAFIGQFLPGFESQANSTQGRAEE